MILVMKRYKNYKKCVRILTCTILLLSLYRCGWFAPAWNIHEAAGRGDTQKVIHFLNQGANIDEQSVGVTPLLGALRNRHIETAKYLIEHGANVNFVDHIYKTPPIVYAAMYRDLELTRLLIEKHANVNAATGKGYSAKEGFTALIAAAYNGDVEIGRLLLEHGADPYAKAVTGTTALINAQGRGHKAFEQMLSSYIAPDQRSKKEIASAKPKSKPISDDDLAAYKRAQKEGTIAAYERYLAEFPKGKFTAEADANLDSLYFRAATRQRTIEANQAYVDRFPNGRYTHLARERLNYLPLMNACLKLDDDVMNQHLAAGKTLSGYAEPARMLMRILQKQASKTIRISDFEVEGIKGPSKNVQLVALRIFEKLLEAGADPNAFHIKGFEKAGRKDLGGVAYLYSSGNPGDIVPAEGGGMSALEFAEANNLVEFKNLLPGSPPARPKSKLVARVVAPEPRKAAPVQKKPDEIIKVSPKTNTLLVTLDTTHFKKKGDRKCRDYKPDYSKYHAIVHLAANAAIGTTEREGKNTKVYAASTGGKDPISGEARRIGISIDVNSLFLNANAGSRGNPLKGNMKVGEPGTRITFGGDKNHPFEPIPGLRLWNGAIDIDPECGLLIEAERAE
jgi:ankyrin repeat protein